MMLLAVRIVYKWMNSVLTWSNGHLSAVTITIVVSIEGFLVY